MKIYKGMCGEIKQRRKEGEGGEKKGKMERYSSINMSGCSDEKRSLPGTELAKRW